MNYILKKMVDLNHPKRKRELKRIDWKTVKRVISTLYHHSRMKKSILATACSMGYDKCRLYIDWLEMMELLRKETNDDGFEELILTEKGRSLYSRKFNVESFYERHNRHIEDL